MKKSPKQPTNKTSPARDLRRANSLSEDMQGGRHPAGSYLIQRYARWVVLCFACVSPFLFYSAFQAVQSKTNKVEEWLPESYRETNDLKWFREHFAGDQFVIVSWDGCRIGDHPNKIDGEADDPRIEQLANMLVNQNLANGDVNEGLKLENTKGNPNHAEAKNYFATATTARRILDRMTANPMSLRYDWAISRLKGAMIGPDGHQTCVMIMLSDDAVGEMRNAIGHGVNGWFRFSHQEGELQKAMRKCGIDPAMAHFGGPPVDAVAIDEEGEKSLYRLAMIAMLVGLALAWWSLRSIALTIIVFACGILSAITSLAVVWLTGETTDAFLLSMPSLVYVLAVSGAVHLIKYYRDAVDKNGEADAPAQAIIHGWKPTLLCSVTTAIGLLALFTSDLTPIRKFGIYSATGVTLMLAMLFVFLPAALTVWPAHERKLLRGRNKPFLSSENAFRRLDSFWQRFGSWIIRNYVVVIIACSAVIAGFGIGVTQVRTNIDMMKLFSDQARVRQDYKWLEANIGRLVPIEIVLKFDNETIERNDDSAKDRLRLSMLDRMEMVSVVKRSIQAKFGSTGEDSISTPMSQLSFAPPLPKAGRDARSMVRRRVFDSKMIESFDEFEKTGYLKVDSAGNELWRISVRVAAFQDVDYAVFTDRIRQVVSPIVEKNDAALRSNLNLVFDRVAENQFLNSNRKAVDVVYTGVVPILYKAQRELLNSLVQSTFWSFITITPLLILVTRGIGSGLTAMIPNTLPVLVVFGGMGWFGFPVTIGSMMSASIALGVAVDDTIHFLTWYRLELKTSDRNVASLAAYRRCATPTLQAALISGLGLAVFGFSNFTATKQFGLLMLTILITGVVAELILLPALLASPLGKAFKEGRRR